MHVTHSLLFPPSLTLYTFVCNKRENNICMKVPGIKKTVTWFKMLSFTSSKLWVIHLNNLWVKLSQSWVITWTHKLFKPQFFRFHLEFETKFCSTTWTYQVLQVLVFEGCCQPFLFTSCSCYKDLNGSSHLSTSIAKKYIVAYGCDTNTTICTVH